MNEGHAAPKVWANLPSSLLWFVGTSAVLWVLSIGFVAHRVHASPDPPHGLPAPLFNPPFTDLNAVASKLGMIHQPEFFTVDYKWIYPAPCLFLYKFILGFNRYGDHSFLFGNSVYLAIVFVGLAALMVGMVGSLARRGLSSTEAWALMIATALMSWPIILAIHTGNIEAILWIGVAIAAWAFYRRMWWTAAVLLGVVGAFKIYPLLLLGLFLQPRKYRQMTVSLLIFVTMTIAGLAYIGPTISIAYHNVAKGLQSFTDLGFYPGAIDRDYLTLEHSVVSLIRILTSGRPRLMLAMFHYYMPVAALLMSILFFTRMWKMPRLNQVFVIILAAVMLPPKSYDYTLQMLYIPWAWLVLLSVDAVARGVKIPGITQVMVCLALIFSPEFFIRLGGYFSFGQFKTIALLALLWLVSLHPFDDKFLQTTAIDHGEVRSL